MTDVSGTPEFDSTLIGQQIRLRRTEARLSLSALAEKAGVAKSYLSNLENGKTNARPSGRSLYLIANALGTTMSDLLGTRLLVEPTQEIPDSLKQFAEAARLTDRDVAMLACVNFRGRQPSDPESWSFVWKAIRASVDDSKLA